MVKAYIIWGAWPSGLTLLRVYLESKAPVSTNQRNDIDIDNAFDSHEIHFDKLLFHFQYSCSYVLKNHSQYLH